MGGPGMLQSQGHQGHNVEAQRRLSEKAVWCGSGVPTRTMGVWVASVSDPGSPLVSPPRAPRPSDSVPLVTT